MTLLFLGMVLWWAAHFFKRAAPDARARMGDKGKGAIALALFASLALMVIGYRATPFVNVWNPPAFHTHVNNLLILIALYLMSPAPKKGRLLNGMRHPMLTGFGLWALAHLMVNGDLTAMLTFGVLLIWAVVEIRVINAAVPEWQPNPPGEWKWDGIGVVGAVVLMGLIGLVHNWLGYWPFG